MWTGAFETNGILLVEHVWATHWNSSINGVLETGFSFHFVPKWLHSLVGGNISRCLLQGGYLGGGHNVHLNKAHDPSKAILHPRPTFLPKGLSIFHLNKHRSFLLECSGAGHKDCHSLSKPCLLSVYLKITTSYRTDHSARAFAKDMLTHDPLLLGVENYTQSLHFTCNKNLVERKMPTALLKITCALHQISGGFLGILHQASIG